MKRDWDAALMILVLMVFAVVVFAAGWRYGGIYKEGRTQDSAIEAGVGEWRIDPKTGEKSFTWKAD
jgi:hypothetical protein